MLLALSMLWDVYLSFVPHLLVAIGAAWVFGFTWQGAVAFVVPHVCFLAAKLIWVTIAEKRSPPS